MSKEIEMIDELIEEIELVEEFDVEEIELVEEILPPLKKGENPYNTQYIVESMVKEDLTPRQMLKLLNSPRGYKGAHWNKIGNEGWLDELKEGEKEYKKNRDEYMTVFVLKEEIEDA